MSAIIEPEYVSTVGIPMRRVFQHPRRNTFDVAPIRALALSYLQHSKVSIDPFARNQRLATYTNDLNPDTAADSHLPADEFLRELKRQGVKADLGFFDPPFSVSQAKEVYQSIGIDKLPVAISRSWKTERNLLNGLIVPNGIVISCNWNSNGMGVTRGYQIIEILLVGHGREHNDTICTVERKVESKQGGLFLVEPHTGENGDNDSSTETALSSST